MVECSMIDIIIHRVKYLLECIKYINKGLRPPRSSCVKASYIIYIRYKRYSQKYLTVSFPRKMLHIMGHWPLVNYSEVLNNFLANFGKREYIISQVDIDHLKSICIFDRIRRNFTEIIGKLIHLYDYIKCTVENTVAGFGLESLILFFGSRRLSLFSRTEWVIHVSGKKF